MKIPELNLNFDIKNSVSNFELDLEIHLPKLTQQLEICFKHPFPHIFLSVVNDLALPSIVCCSGEYINDEECEIFNVILNDLELEYLRENNFI